MKYLPKLNRSNSSRFSIIRKLIYRLHYPRFKAIIGVLSTTRSAPCLPLTVVFWNLSVIFVKSHISPRFNRSYTQDNPRCSTILAVGSSSRLCPVHVQIRLRPFPDASHLLPACRSVLIISLRVLLDQSRSGRIDLRRMLSTSLCRC